MYVFAGIFILLALIIFKTSGNFFKAILTSALGGVGAICAVGAVSYFMPLSLGINLYSLVFSMLFSVPGTIFLLLSKTFLF